MIEKDIAKKNLVKPSHKKVANDFLDKVSGSFRRSDLSKIIVGMISPKLISVADKIAESLMKEMAEDGKIVRVGHLRWQRISQSRKLQGGRKVPELNEVKEISVTTRCPEKWVFIDLETGDLWAGSNSGLRRATEEDRNEALFCLSKKVKVPNAATQAAMKEADEILKARAARFGSADGVTNALEKEAHSH